LSLITRVLIPGLKVISEMNARDHWGARKRRFDSQRQSVRLVLGAEIKRRRLRFELPLVITLTRYGVKRLDMGNLECSFKAVQDEIAALIGFDDGEEAIEWRYRQELSGRRDTYAVEIEICRASTTTAAPARETKVTA
jgi:hypothetical protein